MQETLSARLTLDDADFKKKLDSSVKKLLDLDASSKKIAGSLASLSNAFATVGGETGKLMSVVGSLATGLAAGGPLGIAISGISMALGVWAEKAGDAKKAMDELKGLSVGIDIKVRKAQLEAMTNQDLAKDLAIDDRLFAEREKITAKYDTLIVKSTNKWRDLLRSAEATNSGSASVELLEKAKEQKAITENLIAMRDSDIAQLGELVELERKIEKTKKAQEEVEKRKKDLAKLAHESSVRRLQMQKALLKIAKELTAEEERMEKLRKVQLDRMSRNAEASMSGYMNQRDVPNRATLTQTGTVPFADQSGRDNIKGQITGMLGNIVPVFDTFFKGGATKLIGSISTSLAGMATSIGTTIIGVLSSPVVLAAVAAAGVLAMWASIPVVIAEFAILLHELATWFIPPSVKIAFAALVLATGLAAAALGALYLVAVQNTESYKKAQASWDRIMGHFTHGAEGLFEALNPTIYLFEIMAKHMGWFVNNIATFTPASKALFEATKFLAVGILSGAIAVMTAFDFLVTSIGNTINSIISMVNVLRVPMGQDALPSVVLGGISGALLGQTEALRTELLGTSWEDARAAMDDNTEATRENTKAMERISNMPSGYRMRSTIWASQNPIVATVPLQQSITGSLGGLGGMSFSQLYGL